MSARSPTNSGYVATMNVEAVGGGQGITAKNKSITEQNNKTVVVIKQGMLQSLCLSFGYLLKLGKLSCLILKRRIRATC